MVDATEILDALQSPRFITAVSHYAEVGPVHPIETDYPPTKDTIELFADVRIKRDLLDEATSDGVVTMLAEAVARDLDDLRVNGDTDSKESFICLIDGTKKTGKALDVSIGVKTGKVHDKEELHYVSVTVALAARFATLP
jgi:hypothetical protein